MSPDQYRPFVSALAPRYRNVREVARGGQGIVCHGVSVETGAAVAIKVLRFELRGVDGRERFLREIRIASRLDHPRIARLIDSGERAGALYYVMPFVEGTTLEQRLRREEQLPIADAARIAREVAEALAYAAEHGIVHRDVKPANIMLETHGAALLDLGIARAIAKTTTAEWRTSTGVAVGTAAYMSPEQATGAANLDGRSDLYSLGCVLYEMLAGSPPFAGPSENAVLSRHRMDPIPPLSTVRASVSPALASVVYRAMAKSRADRFANAAEFIRALDAAELTPHSPIAPPSLQWPLRTFVVAGALAAIAITWPTWTWARDRRLAELVARADTNRSVVFPLLVAELGQRPRSCRAIGARDLGRQRRTEVRRWGPPESCR